jgi:hypothetical protein
VLAQTWKYGGLALTADQGEILPDEPMRQMMGVFAQLDRGMTVARLRRSRRNRVITSSTRGREQRTERCRATVRS